MGQAAFEVHQTAPQNPIHQSADKLQTHRLPRRHRRAGRGYVLSVSKTTLQKEGVTEQLKAENQMMWVARMNNIGNRAEEIVTEELIYA